MRLGANQPRIGTFNERVILDSLRRQPGQSLTELASTTGLAIPTVSGLLKQLTGRGLVRSIGTQKVERGRPRIRLALVPEARFSIGIHLDPTMITIALLDLAGEARSTRLERGALDDPPDVVIRRIAASTARMLESERVDPARVVGAGVAAPGPIDIQGGRLVDPPWLPGWQGVALREEMERALDMDILFEKDTIAAVTGETWLRRDDEKSQVLIFVYVGIGIGIGTSVQGEVLRGSTGNAGEIGGFFEIPPRKRGLRRIAPVAFSSVDPSYLVEQAWERGIMDRLEGVIGAPGPLARGQSDTPPQLADIDDGFKILCAAATADDPRAAEVLEEAGDKVAGMISLLTDLLDADTVVLGGPYWEIIRPFYEPAIRTRLEAHRQGQVRRRVSVSTSLMGESAGAVGAAALVLDERYIPRATMLAVTD